MEYKVTFDDGSSAYLAHNGVKGMQWGVRNAETLAKYQGLLQTAKAAMNAVGGGGGVPLDDPNQTENGVVQETVNTIQERIEQAKAMINGETKEQHDEKVASLAREVIEGNWGNGEERYNRLQDSGHSYKEVQTKVNDIIYGTNDYEAGNNTSGREDRDK